MTALANLRSQNAPGVRNENEGRGVDYRKCYRPGVDDGFSALGEEALGALMAGGKGARHPAEEKYGRVSQELRLDVMRIMRDGRWRTADDISNKLKFSGRGRDPHLVQSAATSLFSLGLLAAKRGRGTPTAYRLDIKPEAVQ